MEQQITTELLTTIYERAKQFSIAKWSEPDHIELYDDGTIAAIWDGYERGDQTSEEILAEDLTADLDIIIKERKEKEALEKIARDEEQAKRARERLIREKNERKAQYERLKKEFE